MAATVTVALTGANPVQHVLNQYIFGAYAQNFRTQHLDPALDTGSTARTDWANIGFEHFNSRIDQYPLTTQSPSLSKSHMQIMYEFAQSVLPGAVTIQMPLGPATRPSSQSTAVNGDVAADNTGLSPTDVANEYAKWATGNSGANTPLNVVMVEISNEPTFMGLDPVSIGRPIGAGPWFRNSGSDVVNVNRSIDWLTINHRRWAETVQTKAATLGKTVKIGACASGDLAPNSGYGNLLAFINGTMLASGDTFPFTAGTNISGTTTNGRSITDVITAHPYGAVNLNAGLQGKMNSIFLPMPSGAPVAATFSNAMNVEGLRTAVNAYTGGTSKRFAFTEFSMADNQNPLNANSVVGDAAIAIMAAQKAGLWGIDYIFYTSFNPGSSGFASSLYDANDPARKNVRMYGLRDITGRFLKRYKNIVTVNVAGSGNTPATVDNNSVPRLQATAGISTDGSTLGLLVANVDLTAGADEATVTFELGVTPIGTVTGTFCRNDQSAGSTQMPAIPAFTVTGTSFTRTIESSSVYLFEIPISGTPPPPPPPPPPPSTNSSVATLSDDFNLGALAQTRWTTRQDTGCTVTPTSQELQLSVAAAATGFASIYTPVPYDLTSSAYFWKVRDAGNQALTTGQVYGQAKIDDSNYLGIRVKAGTVKAYKVVAAGAEASIGTVSYNSATMTYFRFREAAGTITCEYTTSPAATWTSIGTTANPFAVTGLIFEIGATATAEASAFTAVVDDVNAASSVSFPNSKLWSTATRVDAAATAPPPVLPKLIGAWSTAAQVDARFLFDEKKHGGRQAVPGPAGPVFPF